MITFKDRPAYFQRRNYLEEIFDLGNNLKLVSVDNTSPFADVKSKLEKIMGTSCTFASLADLLNARLESILNIPKQILVVALGTEIRIDGERENGKSPKGYYYQFISSVPRGVELAVENVQGAKDVYRGTTTYALIKENEGGALDACRKNL